MRWTSPPSVWGRAVSRARGGRHPGGRARRFLGGHPARHALRDPGRSRLGRAQPQFPQHHPTFPRSCTGDMNRKFARLDREDPEFHTVSRIKDLIGHPDVRLVLNLHDAAATTGHLHRQAQQSAPLGPVHRHRPGPSGERFHGRTARRGPRRRFRGQQTPPGPASHLPHPQHPHGRRRPEMEKSLSYYAVRQGKAAFGLEASKEFPVELRVYYHLQMIENFLHQAGVRFQRGFEPHARRHPAGPAGESRRRLCREPGLPPAGGRAGLHPLPAAAQRLRGHALSQSRSRKTGCASITATAPSPSSSPTGTRWTTVWTAWWPLWTAKSCSWASGRWCACTRTPSSTARTATASTPSVSTAAVRTRAACP